MKKMRKKETITNCGAEKFLSYRHVFVRIVQLRSEKFHGKNRMPESPSCKLLQTGVYRSKTSSEEIRHHGYFLPIEWKKDNRKILEKELCVFSRPDRDGYFERIV